MRANYNRLRLVGSCCLGAFLAFAATSVVYEASPKPRTVVIFIALMVMFTRVLLWVWRRGDSATAEGVRRRYENGRPPMGGEEVDGSGAEPEGIENRPDHG